MPLAFSEGQLEQIKTFAYQLPRHLCSQYLHNLAQLLPRDFGDADVWRAAHKAVHATGDCTPCARRTSDARSGCSVCRKHSARPACPSCPTVCAARDTWPC